MKKIFTKAGIFGSLVPRLSKGAVIGFILSALIFSTVFAQGITIDPAVNEFTLPQGEVFAETLAVTVEAQAGVSKADVYLLADTTGSMRTIIDSVKSGANTILNSLVAGSPGTDFQFAIGNYKDFPFDAYAFDHQLSFTSDLTAADVAINGWSASGGADGSEGQFFALDQIAGDTDPAGGTIGWRPDAKKIVVWFGDAPAHDPVCAAISGLGYDIDEGSLTTKLVDNEITIIAISTLTGYPTGLDDDPALSASDYSSICTIGGASGQATRLADATSGVHVSGIDETTIVETIISLVESQVTTIDELSLIPMGETAAFVTSITPASYGPIDTSETTTWYFDVTFGNTVCGLEDATYTGTIDVVADGSVEAQKSVTMHVPGCQIEVGIDIKPGSYPNSFNLNGSGTIPVAVLGSEDFDVDDIDLTSLQFGGMEVKVKKNGTIQCAYDDVSGDFTKPEGDPDGYTDLVCHFVDDPAMWVGGDGTATLTGQLLDGTPFEGSDSTNIVPKK